MSADRLVRTVAVAAVPVVLGACDWFTDFRRQPKIDPWEVATMAEGARRDSIPPRGNPQGSVPIRGASIPDWMVSYGQFPANIDSMSGLVNPTPPNEASLANGRMYYSINCAVCHGDTGDGRGPVTRYNFPPIPLNAGTAVSRSDGYLYGMIRNGRGLMPSYNRIEDMDRWDVVNYIRALQGRLGQPAITGPVGRPGEGGDKVPGATVTAPTRPAPHFQGGARDGAPAGAPTPPSSAPPAPPPSGGGR